MHMRYLSSECLYLFSGKLSELYGNLVSHLSSENDFFLTLMVCSAVCINILIRGVQKQSDRHTLSENWFKVFGMHCLEIQSVWHTFLKALKFYAFFMLPFLKFESFILKFQRVSNTFWKFKVLGIPLCNVNLLGKPFLKLFYTPFEISKC